MRNNGETKGRGLVQFATSEASDRAAQEMNGYVYRESTITVRKIDPSIA